MREWALPWICVPLQRGGSGHCHGSVYLCSVEGVGIAMDLFTSAAWRSAGGVWKARTGTDEVGRRVWYHRTWKESVVPPHLEGECGTTAPGRRAWYHRTWMESVVPPHLEGERGTTAPAYATILIVCAPTYGNMVCTRGRMSSVLICIQMVCCCCAAVPEGGEGGSGRGGKGREEKWVLI